MGTNLLFRFEKIDEILWSQMFLSARTVSKKWRDLIN